MAGADKRRGLIFALSVGAMVACVLVLGFVGSSADQGRPEQSALRSEATRSAIPSPGEGSAVSRAAIAFTDAYLAYEVGALGRADRRTLSALATRKLASQLVANPPRIPSSGVPSREWAARVEAIHLGVFEEGPALLANVVVVGVNGSHVLTPTFVQRGSRWLVAGIGA